MPEDDVPDYVRKAGKTSEESFRPDVEDLAWLGDNPSEDATENPGEEALRQQGYEDRLPLEIILLSIIRGHGLDNDLERLDRAFVALTGKERRGRKSEDADDPHLDAIAIAYHHEFWRTQKPPALRPLIRDVLPRDYLKRPAKAERQIGRKDPVLERLVRKFGANKDFLIQRAIAQKSYEHHVWRVALKEILQRMRRLGIPATADIDGSRPSGRSTKKTPK